jgi:RND family efflux transporter MFP subunit
MMKTQPSKPFVCGALAAAALACLVGCSDEHTHGEEGGHEHGGGEPAGELPGQSITLWTARTELFMEHKPLIVGQEVGFAAHVTEMPSFKAVTSGTATITVKMADGTVLNGRADKPSSPGIFRPVVKPTKAGSCQMSMVIEGPQLQDRFAVGPCEVYPDARSAIAALGPEEEAPGRISFLKEQQWKTEFATVPAQLRELQAGVRASGEIRPVAGKEARLTSATAGRVVASGSPPVIGTPVVKGQVLATIAPRLGAGADRSTLEAEAQSARAELEAAEAQLERAERLFAEQAVPQRSVEEARTRLAIARARAGGSSGRLQQYSAGATGAGQAGRGGFQVRAPIEGTLVSVDVAAGQAVEEGQALFTVIDMERVWLVARVFEPDIPRIQGARSAWFFIDGYPDPFTVDESNGKLITIGRVIDPQTRTIPVIFEMSNADGRLRIGQFARVSIATGAPRRALAIPDSAVLDEAGKSLAYVMVEGESFERRMLTIGIRARGWVEVTDGIEQGERVVTKGGYEIKLASASGVIPEHGHAH